MPKLWCTFFDFLLFISTSAHTKLVSWRRPSKGLLQNTSLAWALVEIYVLYFLRLAVNQGHPIRTLRTSCMYGKWMLTIIVQNLITNFGLLLHFIELLFSIILAFDCYWLVGHSQLVSFSLVLRTRNQLNQSCSNIIIYFVDYFLYRKYISIPNFNLYSWLLWLLLNRRKLVFRRYRAMNHHSICHNAWRQNQKIHSFWPYFWPYLNMSTELTVLRFDQNRVRLPGIKSVIDLLHYKIIFITVLVLRTDHENILSRSKIKIDLLGIVFKFWWDPSVLTQNYGKAWCDRYNLIEVSYVCFSPSFGHIFL